ncbi:hydroxymethylglutaryl-CoA lyase [Prosthecomicrobium sp. N25]|uniref:hydroxymethylglutaryl-CoA lyase n=1 Tax=Prosthecomicrobium sp. N25 TaxID=3129254 RepID=UPI0030789120
MTDLPASALIVEVGPRDGLQIERKILSVDEKLALVEALVASGIREIEVGSFVSPRAVPQMAGTDELVGRLPRRPGVAYRGLWLNARGLERAIASGGVDLDGKLSITASETFARRNTNRSIEDALAEMPAWIDLYRAAGVEPQALSVMAAFGCNYEGPVPAATVLRLVARVDALLADHGARLRQVRLADTMGWANPEQVTRLVGDLRARWPDLGVRLHLHDTRGMAIANAYAALRIGVREFDAAVGGLGGCPFAANVGAAGNVATEDLVFLCEETGVATGIDLNALVEAGRLAESMVGRDLPGKLLKAGSLARYRAARPDAPQ